MRDWLRTDLASLTTLHSLAVVFGVLVYVLTTRIYRERRPPSSALAWVLALMALPYLALPAYLVFGRRKMKRVSLPAKRPEAPDAHWAERLIGSFGHASAAPARVRFHANGAEARAALHGILDGAERSLDVATFILGDDGVGREVVARLIKQASAGVRVRLLLDGLGSVALPRATLTKLRGAGVETALFRPLFPAKADGPRNLRNHRKLVIADGARLWAGGRNLADEYFLGGQGKPAWHDLTFDLEGQVAGAAAAQFEVDWVSSGGAARSDSPSSIPHAAQGRCQFLPSGPDQAEDTVYSLLVDACYRAEQRVLAVTPYFVPDDALLTALRLAARRGVRVRLFMPARSNHRLADFVRHRPLRALDAAGAEVLLLPYMNHAKGVVVDETLALCGSVNLDLRSLFLNHEAMVAFYDAAEIRWLASWIEALEAEAAPYHGRAPGALRDFAEGVVLTLAFQL